MTPSATRTLSAAVLTASRLSRLSHLFHLFRLCAAGGHFLERFLRWERAADKSARALACYLK